MRINDVDFDKLSVEERALYDECKKILSGIHDAGFLYDYPDKIRYCFELFPGNYLDETFLQKEAEIIEMSDSFLKLLENKKTSERDILNYIRDNRAYHLVGAIIDQYLNFGHHGVFVFPELQIGTSFKADYLIIGCNSDGHNFVFVEFESPYGKIKMGDGDEGEVIRKGLNQVNDWDRWLDSYYGLLAEYFERYKHPLMKLPREYYQLDKTRVKYVVVAGRRSDFNEKLRHKKRKLFEDQKILLLHYDNIYDYSMKAIGHATY